MTSRQKAERMSAALKFDAAYYLLTAGQKPNSAHDSLTTRGDATKRISRAKAQEIGRHLGTRDRQTIETLATIQLATGAQLRRLVWGEDSSAARSARRQLARLVELRVLARLSHRPGGVRTGHDGYVYRLDVVGQQLTTEATPRRPREPSMAFIDHSIAVTECYLALRMLDAASRLELIGFEAEPWCWRSYFGPGGAPQTLRPDAFVITASGEWEDRWYLEVDRSTESPGRIRDKADNYIRYWQSGKEQANADVFPKVLFVVPDERRLNQLVGVLSQLPAEHWKLFQVTTTAAFAETMESGAGKTVEADS